VVLLLLLMTPLSTAHCRRAQHIAAAGVAFASSFTPILLLSLQPPQLLHMLLQLQSKPTHALHPNRCRKA
jgi:hypothetical protein